MRWPWSRRQPPGDEYRAQHRADPNAPAVEPPSAELEPSPEAARRLADADRRFTETINRWPEVSSQSTRLARLNRDNRFGSLIDQALGSGPT